MSAHTRTRDPVVGVEEAEVVALLPCPHSVAVDLKAVGVGGQERLASVEKHQAERSAGSPKGVLVWSEGRWVCWLG